MTFETILTQDRIDDHTGQGHWTGRIITDHLDEVVGDDPDKIAFIDPRRQITYGALRQQVDHCALGLLELGVRPGDVVSFQLPNWIESITVHYAATRIGAISNPLIPIYRERELGFMVGLARSKVIVVPGEFLGFDYPAVIEKARVGWPALQHVLVVDGKPGQGTSWAEFMATPWHERRSPGELPTLRPDANDVTLLISPRGPRASPRA
ncbi:MAG: AMP-binding protein [Actinoallomurus sp.]